MSSSSSSSSSSSLMDIPSSVEEAGALLGATITKCGRERVPSVSPPKGMPSIFASVQPNVPSTELLMRLYHLRQLLRQHAGISTNNRSRSSDDYGVPPSTTTTPPTPPPFLPSAPSLLAVLMKLLPVSTSIATRGPSRPSPPPSTTTTSSTNTSSTTTTTTMTCSLDTPPMLSIPLRKLWSECVALCHVLGTSSSAPATGSAGRTSGSGSSTIMMDPLSFVRQMITIAQINPKSARASGGIRLAALDSMKGLYMQPTLSPILIAWNDELFSGVCLRALKSSGHNEPSYRVSAMQLACAIVIANRNVHVQGQSQRQQGNNTTSLLLQGAMDHKSFVEVIKVIKQAVTDPIPQVRRLASHLVALLSPMLITHVDHHLSHHQQQNSRWQYWDDVVRICTKNIDDEIPFVSDGWAEAMARCILTALEYHYDVQQKESSSSPNPDIASSSPKENYRKGQDGSSEGGSRSTTGSTTTSRSTMGTGGSSLAQSCSNLRAALRYLVDQYVKAGGELSAIKAGGLFSAGGRAVRVGWSMTLYKLIRSHAVLFGNANRYGLTHRMIVIEVLHGMLGEDMDKQLRLPISDETNSSSTTTSSAVAAAAPALFGGVGAARFRSKGDPSLVRWATCRILRQGLSEVSSEPIQLTLLQDMVSMITTSQVPRPSSSPQQQSPLAQQSSTVLNANQLQVLLVELSNLIATLGPAATASVDEIVTALKSCLSHKDHGVRHEAAIACVSVACVFPKDGRKLLRNSLDEIQLHHAELVTVSMNPAANKPGASPAAGTSGLRMFRRFPKEAVTPIDASLPHQFAIHGWSLAASLLLQNLPRAPGGIEIELVNMTLSVAEILLSFQFNDELSAANPAAVCLCVRAGFAVVSGILSTGPNEGVTSNIAVIFGAWQRSSSNASKGSQHFAPRHDLYCIDAMLASVVVFLKNCSELLLSVPAALSQVSLILEESLQLLAPPNGRFNTIPMSPPVAARLESAKAAVLEAFAWLPSGSYPMASDQVFSMAAYCIRESVETETSCSILESLVSREDAILDAKTPCGAKHSGQLGGARDMEETIAALTCEPVVHGDREAVVHLQSWVQVDVMDDSSPLVLDSTILGAFAADKSAGKAPTPLHDVGSWRKPVDPSTSSKVRLVDAAIHAFASTFGLKSGKEQHVAMTMLESLVPPLLAQVARSLGVATALSEQDKRPNPKEDSAAENNITAVILSCLKSIPQYESTHNVPLSLGPQWMNMAKDLLLTLLPSASSLVRRAAAEGLALLATLGVSEDAHFMQSTVLHSLDELMMGNKPDGKPRSVALEPISAARSGSLLALASIQRTSHKISERQLSKARERAKSYGENEVLESLDDDLPLLQMLSRILPSISFHGMFRDYFLVRTYALHSFALLLAYSSKLDASSPDEADMQLLRKSIEILEGNYCATWTSSTSDFDRGLDCEKMACEASLLAVLLRMMTLLVPYLGHMQVEHLDIHRRFSVMTALALESYSSHPAVYIEAMSFYEVLSRQCRDVPANLEKSPLSTAVSFLVQPQFRPGRFAMGCNGCESFSLVSSRRFRAACRTILSVTMGRFHISLYSNMEAVAALLAYLELASASQGFIGSTMLRSLATGRQVELFLADGYALQKELMEALPSLLQLERGFAGDYPGILLRWILMLRNVVSGAISYGDSEDDSSSEYSLVGAVKSATVQAAKDISVLFTVSSTPRWQVKSITSSLSSFAMDASIHLSNIRNLDHSMDPNLNYHVALSEFSRACRSAQQSKRPPPRSRLVFHVTELVSSACMMSVATLDHSELRNLQGFSIGFLDGLITAFGKSRDPQEPESSILNQYATQIFSSVKHALSAPEESDSDDALRLFTSGCDCLATIMSVDLTKDPVVVRRLLRPTIPILDEVSIIEPTETFVRVKSEQGSSTDISDGRTAAFLLIYKLAATAKFFSLHFASSSMGSLVDNMKPELMPSELNVGVHAAALSLDGARLLLGNKLSLAGRRLSDQDERCTARPESGYYFQNRQDVPVSVQGLMVRSWSVCASYALLPILQHVAKKLNDDATNDACWGWVDIVFPLLLSGVQDANEVIVGGFSCELPSASSSKLQDDVLDPVSIKLNCLRGIHVMVKECPPSRFSASWMERLEFLLECITTSDLMPALGGATGNESLLSDGAVVSQICSLVQDLATSPSNAFVRDELLLVTLLRPLELVEQGSVDFEANRDVPMIISTYLKAVGKLLVRAPPDTVPDGVVQALTDLVLRAILGCSVAPATVTDAANELLVHCLSHHSMASNTADVAITLARESNWVAWSAVVSADTSVTALASSLGLLRANVTDSSDPSSQLAVLEVLVRVASNHSLDATRIIGFMVANLGTDLLTLLLTYGTATVPTLDHHGSDAEHRKVICADALKVLLLGYQQLNAQINLSSDDSSTTSALVQYLLVLLDGLLVVLRFNGLPNHPTSTLKSDVTLGRMSAQAIYSIARTTPAPFKEAVLQLNDVDRALVEFAVRSEMTGYAMSGIGGGTDPSIRKKLNVANFKR